MCIYRMRTPLKHIWYCVKNQDHCIDCEVNNEETTRGQLGDRPQRNRGLVEGIGRNEGK